MTNILNMWNSRNLTLFGKILLINALSTSVFLFNAQIESSPLDFIKAAEKIHKYFLWGGTPKIAHHSLIAEYSKGGMRYKDLHDLISSLKIKSLQKLSLQETGGHTVLPLYWIKRLFKIPNQRYCQDFFRK